MVGLPEGTAEQVACAVVPNLEHDAGAGAGRGARRGSSEHFQTVSSALPFWKRVKTLEVLGGRSAQDRQALGQAPRGGGRAAAAQAPDRRRRGAATRARTGAGAAWFLDMVAAATGRPRAEIDLASRVSELGFDSLTYNELAEGLEAAGVPVPEQVDFTARPGRGRPVRALCTSGRAATVGPAREGGSGAASWATCWATTTSEVPDRWPGWARAASGWPSGCSTSGCSTPRSRARCTSPATPTSSWRPTTPRTWTWASSRWRWARPGATWPRWRRPTTSSRTAGAGPTSPTSPTWCRWSGWARSASRWTWPSGCCAGAAAWWCSPRGPARTTGEMADFLPSLGYLALRAGGGHPARPTSPEPTRRCPRGAPCPGSRDLRVRFGPFLSLEFLRALTEGLPQQEAWRLVAALTQRIVENLRDGQAVALDATAVRAAWDGERLGTAGRGASVRIRGRRAPARPGGAATRRAAREDPGHRRDRLSGHAPGARAAVRRGATPREPARVLPVALRGAGRAGGRGGHRLGDRSGGGGPGGGRGGATSTTWPASSRASPRTAPRMYDVHVEGTRLLCDGRPRRRRQAHRGGLDQRHHRGVRAGRREARRDLPRAPAPHRAAGPTTPASTTRKRPPAGPAATPSSW